MLVQTETRQDKKNGLRRDGEKKDIQFSGNFAAILQLAMALLQHPSSSSEPSLLVHHERCAIAIAFAFSIALRLPKVFLGLVMASNPVMVYLVASDCVRWEASGDPFLKGNKLLVGWRRWSPDCVIWLFIRPFKKEGPTSDDACSAHRQIRHVMIL